MALIALAFTLPRFTPGIEGVKDTEGGHALDGKALIRVRWHSRLRKKGRKQERNKGLKKSSKRKETQRKGEERNET